jgi:hypothetical protein
VIRYPRTFIVGTTLAVLAFLACCGVAGTYFFGDVATSASPPRVVATATACGQRAVVLPEATLPSIGELSAEQIHNAAVIIKVGQDRAVPPRGWVIAVATALQESDLHNLPNLGPRNDHDSIGLFQQRPSQGWGPVSQLMSPAESSRLFYGRLLKVNGWETMTIAGAAQKVQRSAFPDAYAKHQARAEQVVDALI